MSEKYRRRTKKEREVDLAKIAYIERTYPSKLQSLELFAERMSEELNVSKSTAKRDIAEVRRRRKQSAEIDQKYEIGKKLEELALVKEKAIEMRALSVYLGAIKTESAILGLDKLSIFVDTGDKTEMRVSFKKKALAEKLAPINEPEAE